MEERKDIIAHLSSKCEIIPSGVLLKVFQGVNAPSLLDLKQCYLEPSATSNGKTCNQIEECETHQ